MFATMLHDTCKGKLWIECSITLHQSHVKLNYQLWRYFSSIRCGKVWSQNKLYLWRRWCCRWISVSLRAWWHQWFPVSKVMLINARNGPLKIVSAQYFLSIDFVPEKECKGYLWRSMSSTESRCILKSNKRNCRHAEPGNCVNEPGWTCFWGDKL